MPVNLKPTDVVIVGLGAAGGVAVLPLTQAGIEVIGLEAGTWLRADDFAPDELRNNFRGWPQAVQKANREIPRIAPTRRADVAAARDPPDDERRRRHHAALLGAKLAAESVGLQGRQRDDAPLRRVAHSEGSTVEDWPFGLEELEPYYDKVEYEIGVSGRPATSRARSIRAATRSRAPRARVSDAAAARHRASPT
jgi:choline dehydrogenase-like flavoprotein